MIIGSKNKMWYHMAIRSNNNILNERDNDYV